MYPWFWIEFCRFTLRNMDIKLGHSHFTHNIHYPYYWEFAPNSYTYVYYIHGLSTTTIIMNNRYFILIYLICGFRLNILYRPNSYEPEIWKSFSLWNRDVFASKTVIANIFIYLLTRNFNFMSQLLHWCTNRGYFRYNINISVLWVQHLFEFNSMFDSSTVVRIHRKFSTVSFDSYKELQIVSVRLSGRLDTLRYFH